MRNEGYTTRKVVYCFEHIPIEEARNKENIIKEKIYVVEEINWTLAENRQKVHLNRYFEIGLHQAMGLAAYLQLTNEEIAGTIVDIRPATEKEEEIWIQAVDLKLEIKTDEA